jgi:hypothetical protein
MFRIVIVACLACMVSHLLGQSAAPTVPNGRLLALGQYCYTMTALVNGQSKPIGATFQSITRKQVNGIDALAVVVHQRLFNGKFDMRDSFLLRRNNLRPITLDTDRNGSPHVHLDYSEQRITGWKMVSEVKSPIDIAVDGPVWDGNLWGETFAALPLKPGISLTLRVYQYDSGFETFYINVLDQKKERTAKGTLRAWILKAGVKPSEQVEYTVSTHPGLEISYMAGPSSQHLGGDCVGVN